jgi:hypothetical protein
MSVDDQTLPSLQVETLFHLDPSGRLLSVNEAQGAPAPRFYLGRMRHANRWHWRYDLPIDVVRELDNLIRREPLTADFAGAASHIRGRARDPRKAGADSRGICRPIVYFPERDESALRHRHRVPGAGFGLGGAIGAIRPAPSR